MGIILIILLVAGMMLGLLAQMDGVIGYKTGFCLVMLLGYAATGLLYVDKKARARQLQQRSKDHATDHDKND